ncbi:hypothetical protein [Candidatus Liberibacter sp.]|uniref:hypothetical protein n=1 Tax=Candidatus Liberibacter sp. TaxID=34022 RepID=UPI0015F5B716|nr:hypothetical protein [Candidatus Liberibacter sp.]MBA5723857.1 hypothetical protein [Candidatus Liberibacter sp.]
MSSHGKYFSSSGSFGNWFRERCKESGRPDEVQSLRMKNNRNDYGTVPAPQKKASASTSLHELMVMFGWSKIDMVE